MDKRSLLIGLGVLLAGVLLGALIVTVVRSDSPMPVQEQGAPQAEAMEPEAEPVTEPVRIGEPNPPPPVAVPELNALNRLFRGVAERVKPTVVFIEVEVPAARRTPRDEQFEEWHPFFQPRRFRRSAGSGVIVSPDGYVVTNAHVVDAANRIRVLLNDKREFEAEIVGVDPTTDLAVIRLEGADGEDLPVVVLGDSGELEVGEWVLAVGNPFRLTSTVTAGIVSALGRQVDIIDNSFRIEDFIQTDAAINPGNSGGALVNLRGELVGIATAIATESGAYEGYGFAVPVNLVTRVASDLIAYGDVQRGYLGVEIRAVTASDARRLRLDRISGVLISNVAEGSAARAAGLRNGDILLAIDGRSIDAPNQFQSAIALRRPGEEVRLTVWRRGGVQDIHAALIGRDDEAFQNWVAELSDRPLDPIQPEEMPEEMPDDLHLYELDAWGVGLRDLTEEELAEFDVTGGAFVAFVRQGGAASADGLPSGTVVTAVEGEVVETAEEAAAVLEEVARAGQTALVQVRRPDGVTAYYDLESFAFAE